jgi:hypothetical protein
VVSVSMYSDRRDVRVMIIYLIAFVEVMSLKSNRLNITGPSNIKLKSRAHRPYCSVFPKHHLSRKKSPQLSLSFIRL